MLTLFQDIKGLLSVASCYSYNTSDKSTYDTNKQNKDQQNSNEQNEPKSEKSEKSEKPEKFESKSGLLTLLSYNIWNYNAPWKLRHRMIADEVVTVLPDIIAWQEVRYRYTTSPSPSFSFSPSLCHHLLSPRMFFFSSVHYLFTYILVVNGIKWIGANKTKRTVGEVDDSRFVYFFIFFYHTILFLYYIYVVVTIFLLFVQLDQLGMALLDKGLKYHFVFQVSCHSLLPFSSLSPFYLSPFSFFPLFLFFTTALYGICTHHAGLRDRGTIILFETPYFGIELCKVIHSVAQSTTNHVLQISYLKRFSKLIICVV